MILPIVTGVILFALFGFVSIFVLWVMYLAVMNAGSARDVLTPVALKWGYALYGIGLTWDVICNIVPVSVLFLEIPHELTVSARLRRLVLSGDNWRARLAIWFAVNLMNPFSPGGPHIPLR